MHRVSMMIWRLYFFALITITHMGNPSVERNEDIARARGKYHK